MAMLAPGSLVQERYRIDHLIGQGGFGAVYEAVDERLGRRIALKQLLRTSDRIARQFEREARLLANLDHPALPSVIDHFQTADGQFLVMQYVRGTDLADQLVQRGAPFPVPQVLAWGDQTLDVLEYLHSLQPPIVHRDIKPQNIKLKADGTIMLLDFGLAKGFAGEAAPETSESSLLAYTKGYAPPEQIEGLGTDARSDLYALAATLHFLLTNALPVEAAMRLLADARGRPDPLRPAHELNPEVPEPVSRVLEQALELEPDQRPPSAQAMREQLSIASGRPSRGAAPFARPTLRLPSEQAGILSAQAAASEPTATPTEEGPSSPAQRQAVPVPPRPAPRQAVPAQVSRAASQETVEPSTLAVAPPANRPPSDTQDYSAPEPPPAQPLPAPGSRSRRPACLALALGGALLVLLGGAGLANALGWFRPTGALALNSSPAASVPESSAAAVAASGESGPSAAGASASSAGQPSAAAASAAPSSRPDALVSSSRLNLRAGPGEEYQIKASYSEGTPLRVLGKHPTIPWLYVQAPDGADGWMHGDFLLVNVPLANVPVATPPPAPSAAPTATQAPRPSASASSYASASAQASEPAGGQDTARIIAIWPEPGTTLTAGEAREFQIKLQYSLVSADRAIVGLFLEQFPADAGGCKGANHATNGGVQFPIERGEGVATVQVTWNGAQGSGYLSPGVNFWTDAGGEAARPLVRGIGVFGEPCYKFDG